MKSKNTKLVLLSLCCFLVGFGFYKANPGQPIVAIVFTIGISGIIMSILRESN